MAPARVQRRNSGLRRQLPHRPGEAVGGSDNDLAGASVTNAGDTTDDGFTDLLIGAPQYDASRVDDANTDAAAALFYGPITGNHALSDATRLILGTDGEWAGRAVSGGGDLDNDGAIDIAVGASEQSTAPNGGVYVFYGADW